MANRMIQEIKQSLENYPDPLQYVPFRLSLDDMYRSTDPTKDMQEACKYYVEKRDELYKSPYKLGDERPVRYGIDGRFKTCHELYDDMDKTLDSLMRIKCKGEDRVKKMELFRALVKKGCHATNGAEKTIGDNRKKYLKRYIEELKFTERCLIELQFPEVRTNRNAKYTQAPDVVSARRLDKHTQILPPIDEVSEDEKAETLAPAPQESEPPSGPAQRRRLQERIPSDSISSVTFSVGIPVVIMMIIAYMIFMRAMRKTHA